MWKVSLCVPGCPGNGFVAQVGFELNLQRSSCFCFLPSTGIKVTPLPALLSVLYHSNRNDTRTGPCYELHFLKRTTDALNGAELAKVAQLARIKVEAAY